MSRRHFLNDPGDPWAAEEEDEEELFGPGETSPEEEQDDDWPEEGVLLPEPVVHGGLESEIYMTGRSAFDHPPRHRPSAVSFATTGMSPEERRAAALQSIAATIPDLFPALRADMIRRFGRQGTFTPAGFSKTMKSADIMGYIVPDNADSPGKRALEQIKDALKQEQIKVDAFPMAGWSIKDKLMALVAALGFTPLDMGEKPTDGVEVSSLLDSIQRSPEYRLMYHGGPGRIGLSSVMNAYAAKRLVATSRLDPATASDIADPFKVGPRGGDRRSTTKVTEEGVKFVAAKPTKLAKQVRSVDKDPFAFTEKETKAFHEDIGSVKEKSAKEKRERATRAADKPEEDASGKRLKKAHVQEPSEMVPSLPPPMPPSRDKREREEDTSWLPSVPRRPPPMPSHVRVGKRDRETDAQSASKYKRREK